MEYGLKAKVYILMCIIAISASIDLGGESMKQYTLVETDHMSDFLDK
ncbi:MAG: hypothetical protein KJ601_00825 [Nanoarchaeota archaeon]|nr:hypothetical protein [Nanoarchaeota archaeon]